MPLPDRGLLNDIENKRAEHWHRKHRCKRNSNRILSITAIPTGVGLRIDVQCVACGKTKDITDYDCW